MRQLRHKGAFISDTEALWEWEIWQEPPFPISDLDVASPYDDALTIEWEDTPLHEALCPSSATLAIVSATDREFADLYTCDPKEVELRVYKDGALHWRGYLDPEFYEEPYSELDGYDVTLTFTDMGAMGRAKFDLEGILPVRSVIDRALAEVEGELGEVRTSTTLPDGGSVLTLGVDCANYYDETGEPMSLSEALEAALSPLGLRLVQKEGKWRLYDLNALAQSQSAGEVQWLTADRMGAAPTYSSLRLTWSTYCRTSVGGDSEEAWGDTPDTPDTKQNLNSIEPAEYKGAQYWSYYSGNTDVYDSETLPQFTLWAKKTAIGATLHNPSIRCFKVVEQEGGEACEGIALTWPAIRVRPNAQTIYNGILSATLCRTECEGEWQMSEEEEASASALFSTTPVAIPTYCDGLCLRVTLPMLMDECTNPFESEQTHPARPKDAEKLQRVYVPIGLYLRGHSGKLYVWENAGIVDGSAMGRNYYEYVRRGQWTEVDKANPGRAFLEYRDGSEEYDKKAPLYEGKWAENKKAERWDIAYHTHTKRMGKDKAGEVVAYPPEGGELWLEVYNRGWMYKRKDCYNPHPYAPSWILFKRPQITMEKAQGYDTALDTDDREAVYTINPKAKDELQIDLSHGMGEEPVPASQSAYLDAATGLQASAISREGRTGTAQDLLAGTLFSQYAERHTTLSGVAFSPSWGVCTDRHQPTSARFFPTSEVEDCRAGTSEITLTEISKDEYSEQDLHQDA